MTEKFYRALDLGVVPVTFGGVNYTSIAPPKSFIDVHDFKNPKELATFLVDVGSNFTLYKQ